MVLDALDLLIVFMALTSKNNDIALLAVVIGCQLFLAGFLGELISGIDPKRDKYLIEKTLE